MKQKLIVVTILQLVIILQLNLVYVTEAQPVFGEEIIKYFGEGNCSGQAYDIAVDSYGNVYVAGISGGDYITIKYGPRSNQLWVAKREGPPAYAVEPACWLYNEPNIALDSHDNVYVTGTTRDGYYTVKYNTNGRLLWTAKYGRPAKYNYDIARDIAVDNLGNVYVTGTSRSDYATVKYDTDGKEMWVAIYDGPAHESDEVNAMTVDEIGNVYITGSSTYMTTNNSYNYREYCDYATIKYDTNGNQMWVSRFHVSENDARASDISLDNSGNTYVTGQIEGIYMQNIVTVKYDRNGNELWSVPYHTEDSRINVSRRVVIDDSGNLYIVGYSTPNWKSSGPDAEPDFVTMKYNSDGSQIWAIKYEGPNNTDDWVRNMTIDSSSNIYITGDSGYGCATIKYDTDGNELWVARSENAKANGIIVDLRGNIYVVGSSSEWAGVVPKFATFKYSESPTIFLANLNVSPRQVDIMQPVAISANVINRGIDTFNDNIVLRINGQEEQSCKVSINPGQSFQLQFIVHKIRPGSYMVDIGNLSGNFRVKPINSGLIDIFRTK